MRKIKKGKLYQQRGGKEKHFDREREKVEPVDFFYNAHRKVYRMNWDQKRKIIEKRGT